MFIKFGIIRVSKFSVKCPVITKKKKTMSRIWGNKKSKWMEELLGSQGFLKN